MINVPLLQSTWTMAVDAAGGDPVEVVRSFYDHLFHPDPATQRPPAPRGMFPPSMRAQDDKLLAALVVAVTRAGDLSKIAPALRRMGADHRRFGTEPGHYPVVAEALVETLAEALGDRFTLDVETTWSEALAAVAAEMLAGHQAAVDAGLPAWVDATVATGERHPGGRYEMVLDLGDFPAARYEATAKVWATPHARPGMWVRCQAVVIAGHFDVGDDVLAVEFQITDVPSRALARVHPGDLVRLEAPQPAQPDIDTEVDAEAPAEPTEDPQP